MNIPCERIAPFPISGVTINRKDSENRSPKEDTEGPGRLVVESENRPTGLIHVDKEEEQILY